MAASIISKGPLHRKWWKDEKCGIVVVIFVVFGILGLNPPCVFEKIVLLIYDLFNFQLY